LALSCAKIYILNNYRKIANIGVVGLWYPTGPGGECGQESLGIWIGRPKRLYGEGWPDLKPVERKALARAARPEWN